MDDVQDYLHLHLSVILRSSYVDGHNILTSDSITQARTLPTWKGTTSMAGAVVNLRRRL
jgi:hypothetical protein